MRMVGYVFANKKLPRDSRPRTAQHKHKIKLDIEDILHDQNEINESTRMQLDNITLALAELQAGKREQKPRRKIGFIQDEEENK